MSSANSAYCDCFSCRYGMEYPYKDRGGYPFYPTLGQPYVYYAQKEHFTPFQAQNATPDQAQNTGPPQAQNIYSARAQSAELAQAQNIMPAQAQNVAPAQAPNMVPAQSQNIAQAQCPETYTDVEFDVEGFANWLDSKYEQYLREWHTYEGRCKVIPQTSEEMGTQSHCQSQLGRHKRFANFRLHSPWRKRRDCTNKASERDVTIEYGLIGVGRNRYSISRQVTANKSVVYLLEPKDLPRPISECSQASSIACCSVATVVKKAACSRSATDTFTRFDIENIDPVSVQEGITSYKPQQVIENGCKQDSHKKPKTFKNFLQREKHKSRSKSKTRSFIKVKKTGTPVSLRKTSCECPTLSPPRPVAEMGTQYDTLVKVACECTSRQTVNAANDSVVYYPASVTPERTAETYHKQTSSQKNLTKQPSPTTFSLKLQKDVECQYESTPMVNDNQYCTQCGCCYAEMHEKLLCCDCRRMACEKETPAQVQLKLQMSPSPPTPVQLKYEHRPQPPHRQSKPNVRPLPPTPMQQQYAPLDLPPIPPPTPLQQEYEPKPQPLREVYMVTEPQVLVIPPRQEPPSQLLMSSVPINSEPDTIQGTAIKGNLFGRTSLPCTISNSVQTSDHAINLDHGTIRGQPLFLKIICTERLNEDWFRRQ